MARTRVALAGLLCLIASLAMPARADYSFDPGYAGGDGFLLDSFSTDGGAAARYGGKHAVLPNGDIVMAGIVRLANDTIAPFWNIGLVRYTPQGWARPWSGFASPYYWDFQYYVVYPNLANGGSGDARIESVEDIAYAAGKIYVLVTRAFSTSPSDHDAAIVVFNEDGTFQQNLSVILSSAEEYARALDVTVTNLAAKPVTVSILAERYAPGPRLVVAKYNLGTNGLLAADAGFNGGAPLEVPISTACAGTNLCNIYAGDIARPTRNFPGDGMPIYVVGSVQRAGADWDYVATRINSNGSLDSTFGFGGARYIAFDEPGSDRGDFAYRLAIDSGLPGFTFDTLFIAGNVRRSCKDGIGVAAITDDGNDLGGFGSNGRVVHAGSSETGTICEQDASFYIGDLVKNGNELAMAGTMQGPDPGNVVRIDGGLLRVDAVNGSLRDIARLPIGVSGTRLGDARLRGISHDGMGRYLVTGDLSNVPFGFGSLYVSAGVFPADRIFADGFDRAVEIQSQSRP
ncbi:MAG: hypothetical protein J0L88_02465 [Xanthomonadales bacterium]|nr:hypothetical protein [Xanthomonadales bacterium]